MIHARAHLPAVLALLLVAGAARAQQQAAPPPRADTQAVRPPEAPAPAPPPTAEPRARVRSSHTVDVVAPGEKVDTILGRMNVQRPAPPPRGDTVRPPPTGTESRGPPHGQGPGRQGGGRPGDDGRTRSPSPRTDGAPPPPSGQPPPPPPPR